MKELMGYALLAFAVPGVPVLAAVALWRIRRSFWPLLLVVSMLAVAYFAAVLVLWTGNANGFLDCYPSCTRTQGGVEVALFYGGGGLVLSGLFCVGALIVLAVTGRHASTRA